MLPLTNNFLSSLIKNDLPSNVTFIGTATALHICKHNDNIDKALVENIAEQFQIEYYLLIVCKIPLSYYATVFTIKENNELTIEEAFLCSLGCLRVIEFCLCQREACDTATHQPLSRRRVLWLGQGSLLVSTSVSFITLNFFGDFWRIILFRFQF